MSKKLAVLMGCLLLVSLYAMLNYSRTAGNLAMAVVKNTPTQVDVVTKDIRSDAGDIVIAIENAKVDLTKPNQLDGYSCIVRNGGRKSIRALSLLWTFKTINNGVESGTSEHASFNSLVHPDLRDNGFGKPLESGQSISVSGGTVTKWDKALFQRAEVSVEYVEFEDGTTLGEGDNSKLAALKLQATRDGAEKYKRWLKAQYLQKGKSVSTLLTTLKDAGLPVEMTVSPSGEMGGAQLYRRLALSIVESGKGEEFASKYLN